MNVIHRLLVSIFACLFVGLAACGGSSATHTGNSTGTPSPSSSPGSTPSGSAGATGICTLLSKSQIQQIFGFPVGFSDFTDPQATSSTDRSALCVFASATSASNVLTLTGDVSTTPDGANQAYMIGVGSTCPQPIAGLGDEACTEYDVTTSSYAIFAVKGKTEITLALSVAAQDASVPGKLQQAVRIILGEVH